MKIKTLASVVVFAGMAVMAKAGTIASFNLVDVAGNDILITNGGVALSSGFVGSGYFSVTDSDVTAAASNPVALLALGVSSFTALGTDNFQSLGTPGLYDINVDYGAPTVANAGKTLYTFIGNGATLATSTAILVFRHAATIDGDAPVPDSNTLMLTDGTLISGAVGPNTTYDASAVDPEKGVISAKTFTLVQVIPEPSTALLGAIGALGLLRRRR